MDLIRRDVRPKEFVTRKSIENAIACVAATGGSTTTAAGGATTATVSGTGAGSAAGSSSRLNALAAWLFISVTARS